MAKIFLSYRRQDSAGVAGRIYDRLRAHFGNDAVFMDIDNVPFGVDFREHIDAAVSQCDVVLAVIGPRWSGKTETSRRIDDPRDFVRIEIESALQRGIPVIPVLLDRTRMPTEDEVPSSLSTLTYRNAIEVDQGRDFHPHVDRLIRGLEFHARRATAVSDTSLSQAQESGTTHWTTEDPVHPLKSGSPNPDVAGEVQTGYENAEVQSPKLSPPRSEPEWRNSIGITFRRIAPGSFLMGTTKSQADKLMRHSRRFFPMWLDQVLKPFHSPDRPQFDTEQPVHEVRIGLAFHLSITAVTQDQYSAVTGRNPSHFRGSTALPVDSVSSFDAVEFCNKLSEREKRMPFYRIDGAKVAILGGNGYRLPTEAEWEYACRAGTSTLFPFGDDVGDLAEHAWYSREAEGKTHPVRQKRPNAWGLYDMLGNLGEWCTDWWWKDYYASSPSTDPLACRRRSIGSFGVVAGATNRGTAGRRSEICTPRTFGQTT